MKTRIFSHFSVMMFVLCFFWGCGEKTSAPKTEEHDFTILNDYTSEITRISDSILTSMTLEQRVGQCLMPSLPASSDPSTKALLHKFIEDFHVGGIVLMSGDLESAKTLSELSQSSPVPLFVAIDAEWGLGMRLLGAPVYPKNGNINLTANETDMYDYGREIARECREVGINMVLGPVVDVTNRNHGVIGKRSFGDNALRVSELGVAYAKGLESGGIISVAKHFPGHGSAVIDSHKRVAKITRDISTLDSLDLKPFRDYVSSGLTGVMAGHIEAKALDPDGKPASVSMDMLTNLLREELKFDGLILTDAFDMGGAKGFSASDALLAGADLVLSPLNVEEMYQELLEKVRNGNVPVEVINNRCRRILFYKSLIYRLNFVNLQ